MAVGVEEETPFSGAGHDSVDGDAPVQPPARRRWSLKALAAGVAALATVAAVFFFTGSDEAPPPDDEPAQDGAAPDPGVLEDDFVVFTDPDTGITVQHPESWVPRARPEASQRLLLNAGGQSSVLIRVDPIDGTVDTPEKLAQVQTVTDRIAGAPGVQVVHREAVEINGMLGVSYLSRFTDEDSGTKVANAQYFLFSGNTMYNVLFQAVPEEEFDRLAPVFNKILASFHPPPPEEGSPPAADAPAPG